MTRDEVIDAARSVLVEFQATVDKKIAESAKGGVDPLTEEKIGRLNKALDTAEDLNQKITQAQLSAKNAETLNAEVKERLDGLEIKLNRPGQNGPLSDAQLKAARKKRFNQWVKTVHVCLQKGEFNISADQRKLLDEVTAEAKALNITDDTGGGYLAPVEYNMEEILKTIVLFSPVRALARVRQTAAKSVVIPKRTGLLSAVWASESGQRNPSAGLAYGDLEIPNYEIYAIVDISNQMLEDSAFDMGAEITAEVTEQFAVSEGQGFVSGNGVGKMEGFITNAAVQAQATHSGASTGLTADAFIALYHNLKTAYARNGVWSMNRQTVGQARQLKDGDGRYLFMMSPNGEAPNTFLGAPYVEVPDMPNVAAGAYPVAFGDFYKGYSLVDRIELVMLRDPFTQASSGAVRYWFRKRLGGMVTMPEAIQPMLISL